MPRPANRLPGNSAKPTKKATGRPPKRSYQTAKADDFFPPSDRTEPAAESSPPFSLPNQPLPIPTAPPAEGERSLLDYFAAQAINGLLAGKLAVPNTVLTPTETARLAYDYAEALLSERIRRFPSASTPVPVEPPHLPRPTFDDDEMPF
jgi:hypothetical protein